MGVLRERERVEVVEPARVDNLSFENRQRRKGRLGMNFKPSKFRRTKNKKNEIFRIQRSRFKLDT
jgi:hypothetical protein